MAKQVIRGLLEVESPHNAVMIGYTDGGYVKITMVTDHHSAPFPPSGELGTFDEKLGLLTPYLGFSGDVLLSRGYGQQPTERGREDQPETNNNPPRRRFAFSTDPYGKEDHHPNVKSKSKYARKKGKRKRHGM